MNKSFIKTALFNLLPIFVLIAAGAGIYSNTLSSPFLFDDSSYILDDSAIRMTTLDWANMKEAALEGRPRHRLLANLSFAVNYYFGKYNVFGYHLVNITIHILTGIFLFFFVKSTLVRFSYPIRERPDQFDPILLALTAALLWLVLPVNTQSVTYVVQRMTSLAALFYIVAMWLYLRGRITWERAPNSAKAWFFFAGCIIAGISAVITKQNTATLPLVIILYEWFFFQDLSFRLSKRRLLIIAVIIVVFLGIAFIYLGGTPLHRILISYTRRHFTMPERVMTEFRIVIYYVTLFFWPAPSRLNLDHDYPLSHSLLHPPTTIIAFLALAMIAGFAIYNTRELRLIAFCILWFLLNLVIESSIIGIELIYEHRTYLPFMMVCLLFAATIYRRINPKYISLGILCGIVLFFSFWAYQRNQVWQNPVTFWEDCTAKSPADFRPHNDLGVAYYDAGRYKKSISQYHKALAIKPKDVNALNNMGNALMAINRVGEAADYFKRALRIKPEYTNARNNLGNALIRAGQYEAALEEFEQITNKNPGHFEAHINSGVALARLGRVGDAIDAYKQALSIYPDSAEAHNNLGVLLVRKQNFKQAVKHFQTALQIRPGYNSAKANLNKLNKMTGRN